MSLMLRMMSVTSSVTPAIVSNSCSASSKRTAVMAAPGMRRQQDAAQRVADRVAEAGLERADGEALTVVLLVADGFDGGALDDEHVWSLRAFVGGSGLLRVQLDDERLADGHVDVLALRAGRER